MIDLMTAFLPGFLKKSKLYFLLSALLTIFLLSFMFSSKSFAAPLGANDVNLHSWTQISSLDIVSALGCQALNYDSTKRGGAGCAAYDEDGKLTLMEKPGGGGAVAFTGNLIASLYQNPAASSKEYLAYLQQNLGIVQPVYAQQGTGFGGLTPILPIWAAIRNVTYIIFIILFIVTGILIMFRMKINPQTVISVQNALPKIVVTLILITFSYAIAGFLIDLMYVLMFIVTSIFKNQNLIPGTIPPLQELLGKNIFEVWGRMPLQGFNGLIEFGKTIADIVDAIVAGFPAVGGIAGGLAFLILGIALLWALFRLFFSLLKAYIFVLALVIFGPLMLLADALPGRAGGGLSGWIRGMASNLLVFPFVWTMFLFASALIKVGQVSQPAGWIAPFLGTGWGAQQFPSLLALGVILLTPQALKMLEDALKPPPFPYGTGMAQAVGAGIGYPIGVGRGIGATMAGSREYMVTRLGPHDEAQYGQRGFTRTFLGRLLGR